MITYDIIGPLTQSEGYDGILTIVDKFSKYTELIPIHMTWTAEHVMEALHEHIIKRYGTPEIIISDRDPRFRSEFMDKVAKQLDIDLRFSTAYHPETDGQTERINQEIGIYLRHYTAHNQEDWKSKLTKIGRAHV